MARYSTRARLPLPGLYSGTRTSAERLLWPQVTVARRLVAAPQALVRVDELVRHGRDLGSVTQQARMNWRPIFDSWYSTSAS